jgi:hypothetical protein
VAVAIVRPSTSVVIVLDGLSAMAIESRHFR